MSTFDDGFANIVLPDHLDYFGRTITIIPPHGEARQIRGVLTEVDRKETQQEYGEEQQEELWLTCHRDESHADGGIAEPQTHLVMIHPDETVDSTPFTYQGDKQNVGPHVWDLLFARNRQSAIKVARE